MDAAGADRSASSATIFELASAGDVDAVARRIAAGFSDVNSVNREGFSALHFAVQEGHIELVDYLLASHADANLPSVEGVTPLFMVVLAPRSKQVSVVERLVAKQASPAARNRRGVAARDYLKVLGGQPLQEWIERDRQQIRGQVPPT